MFYLFAHENSKPPINTDRPALLLESRRNHKVKTRVYQLTLETLVFIGDARG